MQMFLSSEKMQMFSVNQLSHSSSTFNRYHCHIY